MSKITQVLFPRNDTPRVSLYMNTVIVSRQKVTHRATLRIINSSLVEKAAKKKKKTANAGTRPYLGTTGHGPSQPKLINAVPTTKDREASIFFITMIPHQKT